MKCGGVRVLLPFLLVFLLAEPAYGNQYQQEDPLVPVIIEWQEGHGFGKDGKMLYDGWAFDPENGSYVNFSNGSVLVKADRILAVGDYGEFFTDTEEAAGTLAIRGNIMRHFSGDVRVAIENVETHMERTCSLTYENGYRFNMPVPEGQYQVKEAEAVWNQNYYKVSFSEESQEIKEGNTCLIEIHIMPEGDGSDDENTWERISASSSESKERGPSVRISNGDSSYKKAERTSMHWPEIYLIVGIFIVSYGFYRYWMKRK